MDLVKQMEINFGSIFDSGLSINLFASSAMKVVKQSVQGNINY